MRRGVRRNTFTGPASSVSGFRPDRLARRQKLPLGTRSFVVLTVLLGLSPTPARAQSDDHAPAAQALFDEAKALMTQGKAALACPKLEESQRLDPALGTQLNLADCYEKVGKTATAWSKFLEAAAAAGAAGRADAERAARERAAALVPRLLRLVVEVTSPAASPGLVVRRNGAPVGAAQWGASIPVDPGSHVITAEAPGHIPWRSVVVVDPGNPQATVRVPQLAFTAAKPLPAQAATEATPAASRGAPARSSDGWSDKKTVALALGATGSVAVGVSLVLGVVAKSQYDAVAEDCPRNECTEPAGAERDSAKSKADLATVFGVAGLGAIAGGVTLWLLAPDAPDEAMARSLKIHLHPSGISVGGTL